jgi:hypothetical protein
MFGYDSVNINNFGTSQATNVILEPFCKVEPYLRRKFLEEQMRICFGPFLCYFWRKKSSLVFFVFSGGKKSSLDF